MTVMKPALPALGIICTALSLMGTTNHLHAHEGEAKYDRISLTANASSQIEQDELQATLYATSQGDKAKDTANAVSKRIQKALSIVERERKVKSQTGNFTTQPIYDKRRITGWRSRQTIHLKSLDAPALSQLLSRLQNDLQVESVHYGISDKRLKDAENNLMEEAVKNFQQRARLLTHSMHREKYRLVEMHVNTGNRPTPIRFQSRTMMAEAAADVAPPIQAGTQRVQVNISGIIEVQLKD